MQRHQYKITAEVWLYSGKGAWYFITIPKDISQEIKFFASDVSSAFGSVRVNVKIGNTTWKTSLFPDNKYDAYLLPIKAEVRKKEKISEGNKVTILLEIV